MEYPYVIYAKGGQISKYKQPEGKESSGGNLRPHRDWGHLPIIHLLKKDGYVDFGD